MRQSQPYLAQVVAVGKATVASENAVDSSIQHLCRLLDTTFDARITANLHANTAEPVIRELRASLESAFETRSRLLTAHNRLGALAADLGVTPQSSGIAWPCQPEKPKPENGRHLEIVAA